MLKISKTCIRVLINTRKQTLSEVPSGAHTLGPGGLGPPGKANWVCQQARTRRGRPQVKAFSADEERKVRQTPLDKLEVASWCVQVTVNGV